jgi:Tfp pilus assembly protein PilX
MALFFSLVMLTLATLLAVTAFRIGSDQTLVVANAQHRNEAMSAAQQAIGELLNSSNFVENPAEAIVSQNCGAEQVANSWCVDINGDGKNDFSVALVAQCVKKKDLPPLDMSTKLGRDCSIQCDSRSSGYQESTGSCSRCTETVWEISAQADDLQTGASVGVAQGVYILIARGAANAFCPVPASP